LSYDLLWSQAGYFIMGVICPICGYDQGEERVLVGHLLTIHQGIPHTSGEDLFTCKFHAAAGPMNHLEFVKHAQSISSYEIGPKPVKCEEVKALPGQLLVKPVDVGASAALEQFRLEDKPWRLRQGFSISVTGGFFMMLQGYQLSSVVGPVLHLVGWAYLAIGLGIIGGSLIFYASPWRYRLASSVVLVFAGAGWSSLLVLIIRIVSGFATVGSLFTVFVVAGPLLATVGAVANLIWNIPVQWRVRLSRPTRS
jgi:hypothetical protein